MNAQDLKDRTKQFADWGAHAPSRARFGALAETSDEPKLAHVVSADGAASIASLGKRPRNGMQITRRVESTSQTHGSERSSTAGLRPPKLLRSAFSAHFNVNFIPGALPQADIEPAPSALNTYRLAACAPQPANRFSEISNQKSAIRTTRKRLK